MFLSVLGCHFAERIPTCSGNFPSLWPHGLGRNVAYLFVQPQAMSIAPKYITNNEVLDGSAKRMEPTAPQPLRCVRRLRLPTLPISNGTTVTSDARPEVGELSCP